MRELLTASQLRAFRACRRMHHHRYEQLISAVGEESPEMRFGTLVHLGLEAWWQGKGIGGAHTAMRLQASKVADPDPTELIRAEVLLLAYDARWREAPLEPLAVEVEFRAPLINPATGARSPLYDLGGKIDVIVRNKENGRTYLVEHKCLPGDAWVWADGGRKRVEDLAASPYPGFTALGFDGTRLVQAQAKKPVPAGVRDIYQLLTANGRRLRASENHPVLTRSRGWVPMAALRSTDYVAIPSTTWSKSCERMSEHELSFIGLMIGDGNIPRMMFTKKDPRVIELFCKSVRGIGDEPAVRHPSQRATYVNVRNPMSSNGRKLLTKFGLDDQTLSAHKFLHDRLLSVDDWSMGILLGALWSTDGCVDTFEERRQGSIQQKVRICYSSTSRRLCSDIQSGLLSLGIHSSVTTQVLDYKDEPYPYHRVAVVGRESKRIFLRLALEGRLPIAKYNNDHIRLALTAIKPGADPKINETGPLRWDRVESILACGREMTWNIEVPGLNNFVAGDIVTHNTTTADISDGGFYWNRLRIDDQISIYHEGAKALGHEVHGCIYDVLVRPKIRLLEATPEDVRKYTKGVVCSCGPGGCDACEGHPGWVEPPRLYAKQRDRDETLPEYHARIMEQIVGDPQAWLTRRTVVRLEDEIDEHAQDVWQTAQDLRLAQRNARWPRNPDACMLYEKLCPFFHVCTGAADLGDRNLFRIRAHAHQELAHG